MLNFLMLRMVKNKASSKLVPVSLKQEIQLNLIVNKNTLRSKSDELIIVVN